MLGATTLHTLSAPALATRKHLFWAFHMAGPMTRAQHPAP